MFRSLKLRWKILLALVGLSVVPLAVALLLLSGYSERQLTTSMHERMDEVAAFVKRGLDHDLEVAGTYIALASQNTELINSIYFAESKEEMLELGTIIEDTREAFGFSQVQVLNPQGHQLRRLLAPAYQGLPSVSGVEHPLLQQALQTQSAASGLDEFDGMPALVTIAPITFHKKAIGYLVGVVLLDDTYLARLGTIQAAKVAFYDEAGRIHSNSPQLKSLKVEEFATRASWQQTLDETPYVLRNTPFTDHNEGMLVAVDLSPLIRARADLNTVLVVILLGVGALAVLIGVAISRGIVRPLNLVVANLQEIAEGEADLTRTLEVSSNDEIGQLACSFNLFLSRLREMVQRTQAVRLDLREAASKIRNSAGEVNRGALDQSKALQECFLAIQGIDQSLSGVAESTGTLVDAAEDSSSATLELGSTIEQIAAQMENLFATVDEVSSSIAEMSVASQQISDNVEVLASSTEVTASSVTEMDVTIKEIEENAERTSRLSEEATRDALDGKTAVDATIAGIGAIREMVDRASATIEELGAKSQDIGRILTVIDEVADQTSLLALNAAIIAAQAGEHGKGFAVVAAEIRDLAQRTAVSTREIGGIIQGLQLGTTEAVVVMKDGSRRVHEEVVRSKAAGAALEKIRSSSLKAGEQVRGIVRATQEQSLGSRQITQSINQVAAMLDQIANAIRQQNLGIRQLAQAAESMRVIASQGKQSTGEQAKGSRQIARSVENIRAMVERIDAATREQTARSCQVVDAMSRVRQIADQNVVRTEELDQVVESLTGQTATLEKEVGSFKA